MLLIRWHDMTLYRWTVDIILYIKGCWKNEEPSQCSKQHLPFTSLILQKAANESNSVQPHAVHTDLAPSWSKSLLFLSGKSCISTMEIVVLSLLKFRLISTDNWNFSEFPLVGRESHRNGCLEAWQTFSLLIPALWHTNFIAAHTWQLTSWFAFTLGITHTHLDTISL